MKTVASELIAWIFANVICVVAAVTAVFVIGEFAGWGQGLKTFYVSAIAVASLTWGSWAALVWTRTRPIRVWMRFSTAIPGAITLAIGGLGAYVGVGALFAWIAIMLAGIGMMAAALILARRFGAQAASDPKRGLAIGLGLFPPIAVALSLVTGSLWYQFINNPMAGDWRSLLSIATVVVSILAMALISTVIPAVASSFCQHLCQRLR